jgi:beta-lactamase class A
MQAGDQSTVEPGIFSSCGILAIVLIAILAGSSMKDASQPPSGRTAGIAEIVDSFPGVIGVAARDLITGEEIAVNADTRFPTASPFKTAGMIEA